MNIMIKDMDNTFNILVPYWGAYVKYGWEKNDFGIGLEKNRVDALAKLNETLVVKYGHKDQEYTISAKEAQKYPVEQIKDYNKYVYIVKKSALNYRKKKELTQEEIDKENYYRFLS